MPGGSTDRPERAAGTGQQLPAGPQRLAPVRELGQASRGLRLFGEHARERAQRRRDRFEDGTPPGRHRLPRGSKIVEEDAPGHAVDPQVVDGEQQLAGLPRAGVEPDRLYYRPGFGIEPSDGRVGLRGDGRVGLRGDGRAQPGGVEAGHVDAVEQVRGGHRGGQQRLQRPQRRRRPAARL